MYKKEQIQLFENRNVRTMWDEQEEEWYFSIVDVVAILTDQQDSKKASTYWSVLKGRLRKEGANEPLTKCKKLKMLSADGKAHPTDAATAETLFRIIQSIPSKKAEPFKQWMAQVASDRLDQMQDPELNILAEASTAEISKAQNPQGYRQSADIAHKGGQIAGEARKKLEEQIGHTIISPERASDYLPPADRWASLPEETETENEDDQ